MFPPDVTRDGVETAPARFLIANATSGETLRRIAALALTGMDSADGSGLTLLEGRKRPVTAFASDKELS